MKNKPLSLCDATIAPGEVANLAMPLPERYSCAPLYMPIKVIHGRLKGPTLVVFSGLKGTELNGLEIAHRLTRQIAVEDCAGTLLCIPVVNVYGLTHYPSILPVGANLPSCFPGDPNGSFGERLAYVFTQEILKKADLCIELQTGGENHNILPQVYCNFSDRHAKRLARSFHAPVVTDVALDVNPLRQTTEDLHVPLLVYQGGEAMRFDENAIELGVNGIKHVMSMVEMLKPEHREEHRPIFSKDEEWTLAHKAGILHPTVSLGQSIQKDEVIGTVMDPFGVEVVEPVRAPQDGIVVGINTSPLIHEGMPIFKLASFLDYDKAESMIEAWDQKQPDSYINS